MNSNSEEAVCACLWEIPSECVGACTREKWLSLSRNDAFLHVICVCGQGGHDLFLFRQSNGAKNLFPRNLCGLLSQPAERLLVHRSRRQRGGDQLHPVTDSLGISRDRQAWECPQSKLRPNYSYNRCNRHLLKRAYEALNVMARSYVSLSVSGTQRKDKWRLFIV